MNRYTPIISPGLFVVFMVIYALFVLLIANPAIDQLEEAHNKQFKIDKAKCEAKGGIAIRSSWDGLMKDCKL